MNDAVNNGADIQAIGHGDVKIHNDLKVEEDVTLPWDKIPAAFRVRNAVYLYAAPTRAFILPDGQADAPADELWRMIVEKLPKGRASTRTR